MKKRLLSLLLAVCMVTVLFAGLSTTAMAETPDKVTGYLRGYTFQAGDTVYGVCETMKINFPANYQSIAKINGITNFNYMFPGTKLWLPVSSVDTSQPYYTLLAHIINAGETPAALCQSYGIDYNANTRLLSALNTNLNSFMVGQTFLLPIYVNPGSPVTPTSSPTAAPTGAPTTAPTGAPTASPSAAPTAGPDIPAEDTVSYYLSQHVLQYGETVSGICAAMDLDFGKYSDTILRINNIGSYTNMLPGKVLLFPSNGIPSGSYYKVMAHKVQPGDTVYDLCLRYKLNFNTYSALIQRLNNNRNLTSFYPGETLYMPLYVSSSTPVTPTAAPTGAPTAAPTGAPTAAPTGAPTGSPGASPTAAPVIPEEDTLHSYLAVHVLQYGETVSGVCADIGADFDSLSGEIMRLSNIQSYSYLLPGKAILIPVSAPPASGPYYKIMAHKLVAGDTVYGLCTSYGLNYTNNMPFLQRLNNRTDLSSYYVGDTVYMPLYVNQK